MASYCTSIGYLRQMQEGTARIGLDGEPVGVVTAAEAADAAMRFATFMAGAAKQPVEAPPQKPVDASKPVQAPPQKPVDAPKPARWSVLFSPGSSVFERDLVIVTVAAGGDVFCAKSHEASVPSDKTPEESCACSTLPFMNRSRHSCATIHHDMERLVE